MNSSDNNEPRLREVFLLRERARRELKLFVAEIRLWPGREKFRHFFTGYERFLWSDLTEEELEKVRTKSLPKGYVYAGPLAADHERKERIYWWDRRGLLKQITPPTKKAADRYLQAFFSVLTRSLQRKLGQPFEWGPDEKSESEQKQYSAWEVARRSELAAIAESLNRPVFSIEWELDTGRISTQKVGLRQTGESLVKYLDLIAECGPVHGICEDCAALFIKEKERKLCHDCSRLRQTYAYRKEYLKKKKKEYYRRDIENDNQFKNKKGHHHEKNKK